MYVHIDLKKRFLEKKNLNKNVREVRNRNNLCRKIVATQLAKVYVEKSLFFNIEFAKTCTAIIYVFKIV